MAKTEDFEAQTTSRGEELKALAMAADNANAQIASTQMFTSQKKLLLMIHSMVHMN